MQNQNYVNAFNSFNDSIDLDICNTGTVGTVNVTTAEEYLEVDEHGANEDFSNFLDSQGLELICSLEDALNGDFPELETSVSLSIELDSGGAAFQNGDAIVELKRILQKCIDKLEHRSSEDEYISESVFDLNGNDIGEFELTIERE